MRRVGVYCGLLLGFALTGSVVAQEVSAPPSQAQLEVHFDKAAQRRAGLRTVLADAAVPGRRLPARVVPDPRRQLRIAALQAGTLEPVKGKALPVPGQKVAAGEVLAWLRPVLPQPDRRDIETDLADADRDTKIGELQIERFHIDGSQQFDVKLPTPTLQILTDYRAAKAKQSALNQALKQPLPLMAPRAGTLLRSPAAVGRVVAEGETLFDLVATGALAIEAEFIDDDLDPAHAIQAQTRDGRSLSLVFLGLGFDAAARTHRALYAIASEGADLIANEPVTVMVPQAATTAQTLPRAALFRADGKSWLWQHIGAERFVALQADVLSDDGETVRVRGAWAADARLVTQGVSALRQAGAR